MAKLGPPKLQYRFYWFLYKKEWKPCMKTFDSFLKSYYSQLGNFPFVQKLIQFLQK